MVVSDMGNFEWCLESPALPARASCLPARCARVVPAGGRPQGAPLPVRPTFVRRCDPFANVCARASRPPPMPVEADEPER